MSASGSGGPSEAERRRRPGPLKRMRNSRSNPGLSPMSSSSNLTESTTALPGSASLEAGEAATRPPIWCRSRSPKVGHALPSSLADTGRTVEQVLFKNERSNSKDTFMNDNTSIRAR